LSLDGAFNLLKKKRISLARGMHISW
jgi:hypothetical protein